MKARKTGLELLRIISMCGIIAMHYFGMGGAVQDGTYPRFSWFLTHSVNALCVPLVNCFVIITGYFLINKQTFSFRKPISLLMITAFYGLISYSVAGIAGAKLHEGGVLYAIFPYFWGNRWFVETYAMLLLFAPFISRLIRALSRKHLQLLLTIQLLFFCVWYSIGLSAPVLDDGYGIINFLTLFMLGGYIRLYAADSKWLSLNKSKCAFVYIVSALATFVLSFLINPYGYAFITNIVGGTAAFMFFQKLDIGTNRVINWISGATFDVYLVHSDINSSQLLIYELLGAKFVTDTPWMVLHMFSVIAIVWVLGVGVYQIRKRVFSATVDRWLKKVKIIAHSEEI